MEANQTILYALPSPTYSTGGTFTQPLQNLPQRYMGRWAHLAAVTYRTTMTPTFSAGAIGQIGTNNVVIRADFFDGVILKFQGGFNALRFKEKLHTGGNRLADADETATTVVRNLQRVLHMGPPQMAGAPSDFSIPTGMLKSGELRFQFGAVADVMTPGGTTGTVVAGTVAVTAKLILRDEILIPPAYQFQTQAFSAADFIVAGRALYTELGVYPVNNFSSATTAFAAGAFGGVTADGGEGYIVTGVDAKDLWLSFSDDFARGDLLGITGEPASATDTNVKGVNHATPTALVTVPFDFQPVLWTPIDGRLTKCFKAESQLRLRWTGTHTAGQILYGRILSQPPNVVAQNLVRALDATGITPSAPPKVRTLSKLPLRRGHPLIEFMPWKCDVGAKG